MTHLEALNIFTDEMQKSLRDMQQQYERLAGPEAVIVRTTLALVRQAVIDGRQAVTRELAIEAEIELAKQRRDN